jgi:hypothetical protein
MTQQEEDNSVLLNEYLEENSRRSQLADKAIQARAEAINIEKAAESVDPLQGQEPNTNTDNSDMMYELDTDTTTTITERPPAEENDERLLAKIKLTSHESRARSYNKSSNPSSKKEQQQQQLTSGTGTAAVVSSNTKTERKAKAAKKKASKSKQQ